jgi:hypothetical protein
VKQPSKWVGVWTGVLGVMLALAPLTAASAADHNSSHHSTKTKGSNPNSAICKDVKAEQASSSTVATSIAKAMTSGNFAQAKRVMVNTYNLDAGNLQRALSVIKTAPPNVQTAFKNLLSFVKQIRTDIQNASSLQRLVASFATLGKNPQLETDGATIANWYTSVCGGTPVTTTTVNVP